MENLLAIGSFVRARPRWLFSALQQIELSPPLVKTSRPYPQLSRQVRDTFTRPHALDPVALKLPGISLPFHFVVLFTAKCARLTCLSSRVQSNLA
jgi:hypothetical protein